jgi:3-methylfumaryl-CoA hydratase
MWAGSRVKFLCAINIGADTIRQSTVSNITSKHGTRGDMHLVTIRHEIVAEGKLAIEEEQDIVYLTEQAPSFSPNSRVRPPQAQVTRTVEATPELLFRFSALTFNAHRIHYDAEYASKIERYPGLVVQGPLLATFLIDHFLRTQPKLVVTRFWCRAIAPVFAPDSFTLCSAAEPGGAELWVLGSNDELKMTAHVEINNSMNVSDIPDVTHI